MSSFKDAIDSSFRKPKEIKVDQDGQPVDSKINFFISL